ncbi:MAG: LysR family transcriptional regulator [Sphingomonadales bacterium]|nr:LysR family transcriptional regulator [Sphingomonadales bacterium]
MPAFSRFLRYFMAVGRLGSIRKAADVLNVSASAIDRQILNAEADIGMPLFERLPSGLRLTAAGEIMMDAGVRWQKNLVDVRAQIEDLRGLKRGHVDIAVIDALAKGYVPSTIQSIQDRYPGITIGVKVLNNDAVRMAIMNGEVDFGIFFEPQSFRGITVRAFVEVVLGLLTPAGHPFGRQKEARFSACAGSALIVPAEPLAVCQQIAILEGITGVEFDSTVTSDNIQMIISLVLQGVGMGILTSIDVISEVKRGLLSFTKISDSILRPMILALCTTSSRTPSYAANIVLQELEHGFAQLGYPASMEPPVSPDVIEHP